MFLPIVGLVFYFFFGRSQRRVRMIGKKSYSRLLKKPMAEYLAQDSCTLPINYSRLISLFRNTNRLSPSMETGWKSIPGALHAAIPAARIGESNEAYPHGILYL